MLAGRRYRRGSEGVVSFAPLRRSRCFPATRLPSGLVVQEHHDGPDLIFGEVVLPHRHRRVPGRAFARQARTTLRDAPEDVALGELRDRPVVGEVRRGGAEAVREVARAIETVTV